MDPEWGEDGFWKLLGWEGVGQGEEGCSGWKIRLPSKAYLMPLESESLCMADGQRAYTV